MVGVRLLQQFRGQFDIWCVEAADGIEAFDFDEAGVVVSGGEINVPRLGAGEVRVESLLAEGDVVAFRRGKGGAHQVRNDTDAPLRVLMLSTLLAPDVVEYLDSGKVSVVDANHQRLFREFRGPDAEYWEGED